MTFKKINHTEFSLLSEPETHSMLSVTFNPLTPKISLVILLTVYHIVVVMSVWRIWY